jgi:general secretion pathway protein C
VGSEWLVSASDKLGSTWTVVAARLHSLADPQRARQVRLLVYGLAVLWLLFALARLVWALVPPAPGDPVAVTIVNPQTVAADGLPRPVVNIDDLVSWNLFGTPDMKLPAAETRVAESQPINRTGSLDGIENGAQETRLSLRLQGVVTSPVQETARAIIEHKKAQEQYAVGDKLPVPGRVTLAKILSDRVVLSNGGKYELLLLFDEESLAAGAMAPADVEDAEEEAKGKEASRAIDQRGNKTLTNMAESYRQRLYTNPQSLSDVVKISAVREGGRLQGYRVSAGRARDQFDSLGFKANDIVTAVNGIELDSPSKAMELYRVMRSAQEASFAVRRGEEELTLVVGLEQVADTNTESTQ